MFLKFLPCVSITLSHFYLHLKCLLSVKVHTHLIETKSREIHKNIQTFTSCAKCQKVSAIMNIFPCKILISFRVVQKYKRTLFSLLDIQFFNCKYFYSIQHQTKNLLRILNTELKNVEEKKKSLDIEGTMTYGY